MFGDASAESRPGGGVGKEEMLHDLLDAPSAVSLGRPELRLAGIEGPKRGCYFKLKSLKDRVHQDATTLHRSVRWRVCSGTVFYLFRSASAFFDSLAFSPSGSSLR